MSKWQLKTPVCFIIFNRPDVTERVFQVIRQAKPPQLLVVADGPRADKPGEAEKCAEAREIINQIDWECEVLINYSDVNLGCRKRVSSGLDWVFEQVEEAIILEDDCLPHPTFFSYCEELLTKYRDDERIMMVSGNNFQFGRKRTEYSYYFSYYGHTWGWATWRSAWKNYDNSMQLWSELRNNGWLNHVLQNEQAVAYWSRLFQIVCENNHTIWDYIWQFTLWSNSGLSILPNVNLVSNIGFGSGTHTTSIHSPLANMTVEPLNFPLQHPPFVIRNTQADNFTEATLFSGASTQKSESHISREEIINNINANQTEFALDLINSLPNSSTAINYGKSIALAKQGKITEALVSLETLLNHIPSHTKGITLKKELRKNLTSNSNTIAFHSIIEKANNLLEVNQIVEAFTILNDTKASKQPIMDLDYLRAKCFLQIEQLASSIQCLYEELRYFPNNDKAKKLLEELLNQYPQFVSRQVQDIEFQELYEKIQPYTMLSEARLYSIFNLVKKVCLEDIPGNFVECGVAAGGSTGLISVLIKRYTKQPRIVYAFDSFDGMPTPTDKDKSSGIPAELTGWGTGTCSAPEDSVTEICNKLGSFDIVYLIKGYFEYTLPKIRDELGMIAFLHMDGDWYSSTQAILNNLYNCVSPNGYVQIDDYGFWDGCRQAITEFQQQNDFQFNLQVIDSTGVWFAKSEVTQLNPITKNNQQPNSTKKWLNLGCGGCFDPDWTNIDFHRTGECVIAHNLLKGIPFPDNSFEVVYHSHLLEHLPKNEAKPFLQECYRVLKPNATIRVVIPDLEQIIRLYLTSLEKALQGSEEADDNYNWLMLEMYDQVVRNDSGGDMKKYLSQNPLPNKKFIIERLGVEGEMLIEAFKGRSFPYVSLAELNPREIGQFRQSGEVHQWMYDRYSLEVLLKNAGFIDIRVCQPNESRISDFNQYYLDVLPDGRVRKSDSLFMEAIKPNSK